MTKEVSEKIARGITDKIECNTVDIDDWADFWGFTREEYEEFLDMAIKALEQEPKTGHWIGIDEEPHEDYECDKCGYVVSTFTANIEPHTEYKYCPNCGAKMESEE